MSDVEIRPGDHFKADQSCQTLSVTMEADKLLPDMRQAEKAEKNTLDFDCSRAGNSKNRLRK
jgi:hypothetical protein